MGGTSRCDAVYYHSSLRTPFGLSRLLVFEQKIGAAPQTKTRASAQMEIEARGSDNCLTCLLMLPARKERIVSVGGPQLAAIDNARPMARKKAHINKYKAVNSNELVFFCKAINIYWR